MRQGCTVWLRHRDSPSQSYPQMASGWTEIHSWGERYILVSWMRWCNVIPRIIRGRLEQPRIWVRCNLICQPKSCLSKCVFFIHPLRQTKKTHKTCCSKSIITDKIMKYFILNTQLQMKNVLPNYPFCSIVQKTLPKLIKVSLIISAVMIHRCTLFSQLLLWADWISQCSRIFWQSLKSLNIHMINYYVCVFVFALFSWKTLLFTCQT